MDKILDKDFRHNLIGYLKEAGIKEKEAIDFVYKKYHDALKKVAVNRIKKFLDYIEKDEYDKAEDMMYSDQDCAYLSFNDINENGRGYGNYDIWNIIQELKK